MTSSLSLGGWDLFTYVESIYILGREIDRNAA